MESVDGWATEEFGRAKIGDRRRTQRLVAVAAQVAECPAGQVTRVFRDSATREGAFRLVENEAIDTRAVARASHDATARRCVDVPHVFVAVDGTSLNLTDERREKGTGVVGSRYVGARGFQVMTAMAVTPDGTPMGLCGQTFWARVEKSTRRRIGGRDKRPVGEKETRHWLEVMRQVREVFADGPTPWFQLDRGGDAWPVILDGLEPGQLFTVRAAWNRRVKLDEAGTDRRYLWETLEKAPILTQHEIELPRSGRRRARRATIEVRAREISLDFLVGSKRRVFASIWAILARESAATVPVGENPTEWLLLTNRPIATEADAQQVLFGYAQRWRIEEFHRLWKSGACNVEDNQLRDADHIIRWATILAAVAVRILRMNYLARNAPDTAATAEFTPAEIKAIILGRQPKDIPAVLTMSVVVRWLADLGGYTGKSSGGPPGAQVIARGLESIKLLAEVVGRSDQW